MYSKITRRIIAAFVLFLLLSATLPVLSQVRYNVIDLGSLPGYEMSLAWSINNNGQVVGEVDSSTGMSTRAVLFDTSGTGNNIDLGTLGGQNSSALSINDFGQIVGAAEYSQQGLSATIFDPTGSGNNTELVINSKAWSINDSSQIVGAVTLNSGATSYGHAALFNSAQPGSFVDLGILPSYDSSEAMSINNVGTVIGYAYNSNQTFDTLYRYRAILFDTTDPSHNIDLGTLPGYEYALPFSINDNGQIVGRVNNDMSLPFDYAPRAVLFDPIDPNKNLDLGTLPGYDAAEALSINNRGQIAGRALVGTEYTATAALFDPSGQGSNINLNDVIDPALGWYLNTAMCINDNGWIVGWGSHNNSYYRAFLLIPIPAGPADFDQNGKVDFYDFATFAAAWDTALWDENYNPSCDLEIDGQINYYDLAIFIDGWSPGL